MRAAKRHPLCQGLTGDDGKLEFVYDYMGRRVSVVQFDVIADRVGE